MVTNSAQSFRIRHRYVRRRDVRRRPAPSCRRRRCCATSSTRRCSPTRSASTAFGVGEHHRPDFAISAPEVVLAAIAGRTPRIWLGSAVTVLSTDDPVRVFQRFSTLNAISNGRAEVILGRGSFTESYPLFGYDLSHYEELFEEKLALFAELLKGRPGDVERLDAVRARRTRSSIRRSRAGTLRTWVGVGGSPESVVRAARYGLPLTLAIIGGSPTRFRPYVDLYQRVARAVRQAAAADRRALARPRRRDRRAGEGRAVAALRDDDEPHRRRARLAAGDRARTSSAKPGRTARSASARRRPSRRRSPTPSSALGLSRFDLKYSNGTLPHEKLMTSIELFGTKVAPRVRDGAAPRRR